MPTETTASLLIGPLDTHGGGSVFGPDHVLLLREGGRATWTVTPIAPDDGLVTVLPGSSIGVDQLALAASHGLRVAVARDPTSATGGAR